MTVTHYSEPRTNASSTCFKMEINHDLKTVTTGYFFTNAICQELPKKSFRALLENMILAGYRHIKEA